MERPWRVKQDDRFVKTNTNSTSLPTKQMIALMLAVFTVSLGYGVVLPLLPSLVARLLASESTQSLISQHTGLLTGVYALALFIGAPAWGSLSDARGRRTLLLIALLGFGVATLVFALAESLAGVYVQRFLSGLFAAGVTPIASATIGDAASAGDQRGRRLTFLSMASIAGFLLGPTVGVFTARTGAATLRIAMPAGSLLIPLAATAALAMLVSVFVALAVPNTRGEARTNPRPPSSTHAHRSSLVSRLLVLTFVVSAAIAVFEVGLALRSTQQLKLTPYEIALMFSECSLVMFLMQGLVFSPLIKTDDTRWFIAPALVVLATGLLLIPLASGFWLMLAVIGGVAASAGIASPILTYWISALAGRAQGWELGKQTAASSLGVTLGSVAAGLLFKADTRAAVPFVVTAAFVFAGFIISFRLPQVLIPSEDSRDQPRTAGTGR